MSKKSRRNRNQSPPQGRFPWLWLIVGGALLIIAGGLGVVWTLSGTQPAAAPEVTGAPQLVVDQTTIDEGDVKINTLVHTTFRLRNVGDQPLRILGEPQVELVEGC